METKNINEVIANLSVEQLAGMIDHTFLKPFGTAENIEKLCAEARQYKFAMVAINPANCSTDKFAITSFIFLVSILIRYLIMLVKKSIHTSILRHVSLQQRLLQFLLS